MTSCKVVHESLNTKRIPTHFKASHKFSFRQEKMSSQDANDAFACSSNSCCLSPFSGLSDSHKSPPSQVAAASSCAFKNATISSLYPTNQITNHESLPLLPEMYSKFMRAYPQYSDTHQADLIRAAQYNHLAVGNHVCLDYIGHGLFSYSQTQTAPHHFDISHKPCANFYSLILNGGGQGSDNVDEFESKIRRRITRFLNINEDDYSMVFTANQASAFRLLADAYPFHSNSRKRLVTVYDHESEAVDILIDNSRKRGARVMSAEFSWPSLRIQSTKLRKMLVRTKRRSSASGGLFVFPLQSKMTGARYAYQWMSLAHDNGWHVLLDACALGPKDMETLGLSLFKPDFLIFPFYKVFGENPSGFCCLFVRKSACSVLLKDSTPATNIGMVKLIPSTTPLALNLMTEDFESSSRSNNYSTSVSSASSEIMCSGLDNADSLGLVLIGNRTRFLINWLVNALTSLRHPSSSSDESTLGLVRIYGPKVKLNRGPALAFNIFDWKEEKIDPALVQRLADRNNISLSCGVLHGIGYPEGKAIVVVTAAVGFVNNFEDVYGLWAFVSKFLDADYLEKERWRYMALNERKRRHDNSCII